MSTTTSGNRHEALKPRKGNQQQQTQLSRPQQCNQTLSRRHEMQYHGSERAIPMSMSLIRRASGIPCGIKASGITINLSVNERCMKRASTDEVQTQRTRPWPCILLPFSRHDVELLTWFWTSAGAFRCQPRASRRPPAPDRAIELLVQPTTAIWRRLSVYAH